MASAPLRRLRAPVESPVWGWVGGVLGALCCSLAGGLLALPLLAASLFLLPCYLLARRLLLHLHLLWHRTHTVVERVSGTEACWLSAAWGRPVLHAVLVLECGHYSTSAMDVDLLQDLVLTRVLPLYPRLRARPRSMPLTAGGGLCWVQDSDFSIGRHVFPADCGGDGLQVYVSQLLDEELPADRPPWQLRLLPSCGARSTEVAVVLRVHHALADGDALVRLLCHVLADKPTARPKQAWRQRGFLQVALSLLRAAVVGPVSLVAWLALRSRDDNLLLAGRYSAQTTTATTTTAAATTTTAAAATATTTTTTSVAWSAGIALSKVRRIQQVSRCSLNCVLLAAVGGAVRALLQGCGVRQPPDLKVALPVSMHRYRSVGGHSNDRDHSENGNSNNNNNNSSNNSNKGRHYKSNGGVAAAGGGTFPGAAAAAAAAPLSNKTTPVLVGLPVSVEGAVPRLWATRRCLQYLRSSADTEVVYMASLAGSWSGRLLAALTDKASIQFATLAGPSSAVLVGGAVVKAVYPLQPAPARLGLAVSVLTYADQVFVTVASDAALGPAGTLLLQHFNVQVELLWRLLRHRRAPGESRTPLSLRRTDVQTSPVAELTTRLCYVQEELERLAGEEGAAQGAARLTSLKAEFTSLLHEVRKRQARVRRQARQHSPEAESSLRGRGRRGRRKRAVSFSLPQRSSLSLGGLLGGPGGGPGGGVGGRGPDGSVDAILEDRSPPSSPSSQSLVSTAASVTINVPEDEGGPGRVWVRASFERAALRSHSNLDPLLREYFRGVQLESPGGAYTCRCHHPQSTCSETSGSATEAGSNEADSQDEQDFRPRRASRHQPHPAAEPEQEYEAIADSYYPQQLKQRAKFSQLSPTAAEPAEAVLEPPVQEARRPSCLKKILRKDTPPSDQSSPSLSTSVLHQLRSYYEEPYFAFEDVTSPEDELEDELPPPRKRTSAFSSNAAVVRCAVPGLTAATPPAAPLTCKDADQLRFADADSDPATPVTEVVAALMHPPPRSPRSPPTTGPAVSVPSPPDATSPRPRFLTQSSSSSQSAHSVKNSGLLPSPSDATGSSTSPRPKFLTQSSSSSQSAHSASPRSKRQCSADHGYFEESVGPSLSSEPEVLSTDSVINLTSSSASPSPGGVAAAAGTHGLYRLAEETVRLPAYPDPSSPEHSSEHMALLVADSHSMTLVRPTSLVIKKTYRNI